MTFPSLFVLQCIGIFAVPLHPKTRNNKSKTNMETIYDVFKQQVIAILKEAGKTISQLMKEGKMHR